MTAGSAAARTTAVALPRVLWIEGATPSLGGGAARGRRHAPRLDESDARVAFAVTPPRAAASANVAASHGLDSELGLELGIPIVAWAHGALLPPAGDPRWSERAFVLRAARAGDFHVVLRRSTLLQAGARSAVLESLRAALDAYCAPRRTWRIAGRELVLRRAQPAVMAVINLTPDSFSDGGRWNAVAAVERGIEFAAAGAQLLDVGGESTRPGSLPVSAEQELERVLPVIERLARRVAVPISIDTTKAAVASAALAAGASVVNDTSALADDPALAAVVAQAGAGVVLMHRRGTPRTMQDDPRYEDCAAEVAEQLAARAAFALGQGIARESIVLDPGIGFGKRLEDNLDLVAAIGSLRSLGYPVLLGASRKSFLGALTGRPAGARDGATLATTAAASELGCELVRVHDVAATADLLRVLAALRGEGGGADGADVELRP